MSQEVADDVSCQPPSNTSSNDAHKLYYRRNPRKLFVPSPHSILAGEEPKGAKYIDPEIEASVIGTKFSLIIHREPSRKIYDSGL